MITEMTFDTFCKTNVETARKIAANQLRTIKGKMANWDDRIDDDAIREDSVINAMLKVYETFSPTKGNLYGFLKTVIHNEMVDLVDAETAHLSKLKGIGPKEEADYTFDQMASNIPESSMNQLRPMLHNAISKLSPMDQAILDFYIQNPKTYIQKAVEKFGIKPNNVSLRKNRALKQIPDLMEMTSDDYFGMFRGLPSSSPSEFMFEFMTVRRPKPTKVNFVYPEFDLETTATRLARIIRTLKEEI